MNNYDLKEQLNLQDEHPKFDPYGVYEKLLNHDSESNLSLVLNYGVIVENIRSYQQSSQLLDIGFRANSQGNFRKVCGDMYIDEIQWGGLVVMSVMFSFRSPRFKNIFSKSALLDLAGIEDLPDKIEFALTEFDDEVAVSLQTLQIGGDVHKFTTSIGNNRLVCSGRNTNECRSSIIAFREYISKSGGFRDQFPFGGVTKIPAELVPVSFKLKSYEAETLNISISNVSEVDKSAKSLLINERDSNRNTISHLSSVKKVVRSLQELRRLNSLVADLKFNMQLVNNAITRCRNKISTCHREYNLYQNQKKEILESQMAPRLDFLDHCLIGGYTEEDRLTLDAIFHRIELNQCSDLYDDITSRSVLNLNGKNILSISPLRGLTNLIALDLSKNRVSDISAISTLSNLRFLDLSFNNVSVIEPLLVLNPFQVLAIRDNFLTNPDILLSRADTFIKDDKGACELAIKESISKGLVDTELAESFEEIGFAPLFSSNSPLAVNAWLKCEIVNGEIRVLKLYGF
ncbi:leucine-rich repeat domain-containing protein [Pseudobacteriovorax antillogorgiicola]|nr:leucine-rich repeat domain-containing protein [Pseudobacteriovorax antillogorgiicola]